MHVEMEFGCATGHAQEHVDEAGGTGSALAIDAKQIYIWCQEEDPRYWSYSHSEISQMLCSGNEPSPEISILIEKR